MRANTRRHAARARGNGAGARGTGAVEVQRFDLLGAQEGNAADGGRVGRALDGAAVGADHVIDDRVPRATAAQDGRGAGGCLVRGDEAGGCAAIVRSVVGACVCAVGGLKTTDHGGGRGGDGGYHLRGGMFEASLTRRRWWADRRGLPPTLIPLVKSHLLVSFRSV